MKEITIRPNTQDLLCVRSVCEQNEYRLPDEFRPDDVIIDIGANIGAFAFACLDRGCGKVVCFEPEIENFRLLSKNMNPWLERVELHNNAVWFTERTMHVNGIGGIFTAMYHVLKPFGVPVQSISIKNVLARHPKVKLLKLDCEGSERPILDALTRSDVLGVDSLCGELHYRYTPDGYDTPTDEWLIDTMKRLGFKTIDIVHNAEAKDTIANFFASR